jgi:hypothetical protein
MNPQYSYMLDRLEQNPSDRRLAMSRLLIVVFVLYVLLSFNSAQANLINNGNNLIYDSDLDVTWYNPSFTIMTWYQAMSWADNLVVGGAADWRLPTAFNRDGSPPSGGYNCDNNELGYLYYKELGNVADNANLYPLNSGPFSNLQPMTYWTSTEWTSYTGNAWAFDFMSGLLGFTDKSPNSTYFQYYSAMAVHSGDIGAVQVPEPATMLLLGTGFIGLLGLRRKFRK